MRTIIKGTLYVSLFTIACMVNSVLGWRLPLPDLIPNTEAAPQCVVPGTTPQTTPPGAAVTAYGKTTATGQPALSFSDVFPDLPSAMGELQGQALRKLSGPPPSQAQIAGFIGAVKGGVVRWGKSLRASARGEHKPAEVSAYETKRKAVLAQNVTSCNPCQPGMDGTDPGGLVDYKGPLTTEQQQNAATIIATGRSRGVPTQGQVVALAAALQESGLRNLNYGDRDSLGVFQQRAGWGSATERTNVAVAAGKFYDALVRVPGWQAMPVTQAAQAVQGSAYPGAYARWEGQARALAGSRSAQLTSTAANVSGGMTCAVYPTTKGAGPGPWGGYSNGRIPLSALAHPASAPNALFRPDAAAAFDQLNAAYRARFGVSITVTDSYRDYPSQVRTKVEKGGLAARPGTSNHGWGLAADLGGGIERFGTPQKQWMDANAPRFGWVNPSWARPGGSGPRESWHHEYVGTGKAA